MSTDFNRVLSDTEIIAGEHRRLVGGAWDEIGSLQLAFMKAQGLRPEHRLLDIGCGALRGGRHFIRYPAPGQYYGIDRNASLLRAGKSVELVAAGLAGRQPHL